MRVPYSREVLACRAANIGNRIRSKSYAVSVIAHLIEEDISASYEDEEHKRFNDYIMGGLLAALKDLGDDLYEEADGLMEVDHDDTD